MNRVEQPHQELVRVMMVIIIEELVHGLDPLHELLRVDRHHLRLDLFLGLFGIHSVHVLENVLQVQNEQVLILGHGFRVLVLKDQFPEALAMIQNLKG
jgi:hypothetical protein